MTLPGLPGRIMVMAMDQIGVCFSSGSACRPAPPLRRMRFSPWVCTEAEAHCAVRFSLGYGNTEEEIDRTVELIKQTIGQSKNSVHFVPCR